MPTISRLINDFLANRANLFAITRDHFHKMNEDDAQIDEEEWKLELDIINKDFDTMTNQTWHIVMEKEIQIFENVEEANTQFGLVIMEMLNEFIEHAQTLFVQIRDAEGNFSDAIYETVSRFITEKGAAGEIDLIPEELKEVRV